MEPEIKVVDGLFPQDGVPEELVKMVLVNRRRYVEFYVSEDFIDDAAMFGAWVKEAAIPRLKNG